MGEGREVPQKKLERRALVSPTDAMFDPWVPKGGVEMGDRVQESKQLAPMGLG